MVNKYIIKDVNIPNIKENVSCIGFFDSLHLGHQKLINKTISEAKRLKLTPTLILFNPDPTEIITNKKVTHVLSYKNRINFIESMGIEQIIIFKFDKDLMKISPNRFIKYYLNKLNIKELICGYDFTFGYKGLGNSNTLNKLGKFKTVVINECKYLNKKVSTTRIKEEIIKGNIELVNKLLGWNYFVELKVVDCVKQKDNYLTIAKTKDKYNLIPISIRYGNTIEIMSNKVYIKRKNRLKKGSLLFLDFSNE